MEEPWRGLDRRAGCPLGQFGWTRACLTAFADDAKPHVVGVFAKPELAAVAPLVRKRQHGVCRLLLAGADELPEPMNVAWADERALVRLIRALARGGTPLVFERMPTDSASVRIIRRVYRGRAIWRVRPHSPSHHIALDASWLEPSRRLDATRRLELARAGRKAEERGEVAIEIHTPDLRDLAELLDAAFDVEANGPADRAAVPPARDPQLAVFYRQYAQAACVDGILRICFLRIGDRVAAMQLAVEQGGAFWVLRAGCDARFVDCSPGMLLSCATIRYAAEAGLSSYEMPSVTDDWTAAWPTVERPCVSLRVYPFGVRGVAALAADLGVAAYGAWQRWRRARG